MRKFKINRVLFHVNVSEPDQDALKTVLNICKRHHATLTLLHVASQKTSITDPSSKKNVEEQFPVPLTTAKKELKRLADDISILYYIETHSLIDRGIIPDVICKTAYEIGSDMIIISYDRDRLNNSKSGSFAFDVIMNASCPVLIIPKNWKRHHFRKIVYPIRMNQRVFEKYNYIEPIIEKNNSELIIAGLASKDDPHEISNTVFSIDLLRNMCQEEKIPYTTFILPCNMFAENLIDTTIRANADMIVISSNIDYESNIKTPESFALNIAELSSCPVLCISPLLHVSNDLIHKLTDKATNAHIRKKSNAPSSK